MFHILYTSQITGSTQKLQKQVKKAQKGPRYPNSVSHDSVFADIHKTHHFDCNIHFCTSQMTRSVQKCKSRPKKQPKMCQNYPNSLYHELVIVDTCLTIHFSAKPSLLVFLSLYTSLVTRSTPKLGLEPDDFGMGSQKQGGGQKYEV